MSTTEDILTWMRTTLGERDKGWSTDEYSRDEVKELLAALEDAERGRQHAEELLQSAREEINKSLLPFPSDWRSWPSNEVQYDKGQKHAYEHCRDLLGGEWL